MIKTFVCYHALNIEQYSGEEPTSVHQALYCNVVMLAVSWNMLVCQSFLDHEKMG